MLLCRNYDLRQSHAVGTLTSADYTVSCLTVILQDLGSGDNVSVIVVQLAPATAATLQVPQQQLLQQQQQQQQQQQSASAAAAAASNEHTAQQQQPMSYPDMLPPSMKPRA
jgi:hypothetical protein